MKLEEAVQEIKRRVDLAQVIGQSVKLKKQGSKYLGLCPFHDEKTPSFNVSPDKGFFKCFGCGASGDVFTFLEKHTGQLFIDILKDLAEQNGIKLELKKKSPQNIKQVELIENAQNFFVAALDSEAKSYLTQTRKYPESIINKLGLGFGGFSRAPISLFAGRITIPIRNHQGRLVAFGGRTFLKQDEDRPKYVNSPASETYDKSRVLYGLFESLKLIKAQGRVVVVEGYFDAIAFLSLGLPAVAPCGTSLTESHVELLRRYTDTVILCFDQDKAGRLAHEKALLLFLSKGFHVFAAKIEGKDPDDLWRAGKKDELISSVEQAKDAVSLDVEQAYSESLMGVQNRIRSFEKLMPFLSAASDPLVNRQYVRLVAKVFNEDEALLIRSVSKYKPGSVQRAQQISEASQKKQLSWSALEKLIFEAVVSNPECLREKRELLELEFNSELALFLGAVSELLNSKETGSLTQKDLLGISVSRQSSLINRLLSIFKSNQKISFEESTRILEGCLKECVRLERDNWLKGQHQKIVQATKEGNIEQIRQSLKEQSGSLKKDAT